MSGSKSITFYFDFSTKDNFVSISNYNETKNDDKINLKNNNDLNMVSHNIYDYPFNLIDNKIYILTLKNSKGKGWKMKNEIGYVEFFGRKIYFKASFRN